MSSRKIIQLITFIALLIGILWFIYKPDFEPALTCLLTAATLIGLIVEEKYFTTREVDKKLFEELKKTLPSDGSIAFIDQHNMAGWPFQDLPDRIVPLLPHNQEVPSLTRLKV